MSDRRQKNQLELAFAEEYRGEAPKKTLSVSFSPGAAHAEPRPEQRPARATAEKIAHRAIG